MNPDVIHFEEIPETFINKDILNVIYRNDRPYNIVCTTHSSFTEPSNLKYTADKFILVSEWSRKKFISHFKDEIPCEVWEYPVDKITYDKDDAKKELGFDPDYKHVLHVGLFTPGKNQKEIVDLAKLVLNHKIKFHFVGNQATNFEDYWKPIMNEFPDNCIWHGERSDVDVFYKASDMFYFPSNYELNPLALKEALSYDLPIFIKKLHTYENTYDGIAAYITGNVSEDKKLLLNHFNLKDNKPRIQIVHLLTNNSDERELKSVVDISKLSSYGIDYTQQINEVIDEIPPKDFCKRPDAIGGSPKDFGNGYGTITGRHYGCFLAHTNAIKNINNLYDYTLIFEGDANIETSVEEFVNVIHSACEISEKNNVYYISFANNNSNQKIKIDELFSETAPNQDLAHCYLIPNRLKNWYVDRINDTKWDGYDIWLNDIFYAHKQKRYTTNKVYSNQIEGLSLIDNIVKWEKLPSKYDYVEIGTSDFETLLESMPDSYVGLSIEPIKTYLDRLPNNPNNKKLNFAISDVNKETLIYFIKPEDIIEYNLPEWIKGCNSINVPHSSVLRYLKENNLEKLYSTEKIETISFETLVERYQIKEIDYLKIDTEGHDITIINNLLKTNVRPKKIRFEANSLYSQIDIQNIVSILEDNNYCVVQKTINDIVVKHKEGVDNKIPETLPVLIISTGKRLDYLTKTVRLLFEKNPNFDKMFKKVWVLDDRSSHEDRYHMDKLLYSYFGDNYNTITINSNESFYFVEKFKMIKNLINPDDVVFLMEDDWECHDNIRLFYHINRLKNSDWTQIAFADPLDIQNLDIQKNYIVDLDYWYNPFPKPFKHPVR